MATINGCNLPEDLYYLAEKHVWVRPEGGGLVTIGMNDVAQHLAGNVLALTAKKVGKTIPKGQSVATIESAKWVGPFPAVLSGEVVATNEAAFRKDILAANKDPYGEGWLVRLRPSDLAGECLGLVTGAEAVRLYRERIERLDARCYRCADAPVPGSVS